MASPNSLVDLVSNIAATTVAAAPGVLAGQRAVAFRSGRSGLLDMSQRHAGVWADVLISLRVANAPAYVEIDPANGLITRLLVPLVVRVGEISSTLDGVEVELIISHARHTLRR